MKTLGIVFLVLLALFFGGCAVTAAFFIAMDSTVFPLVALVAALLCVACIAGIRALNRSDSADKTADKTAESPPGDDSGPAA
jgi:hypothetical protein